jgi:hypothetical protein
LGRPGTGCTLLSRYSRHDRRIHPKEGIIRRVTDRLRAGRDALQDGRDLERCQEDERVGLRCPGCRREQDDSEVRAVDPEHVAVQPQQADLRVLYGLVRLVQSGYLVIATQCGEVRRRGRRRPEPMLVGRDIDDVLEYERASPTATEILAGLSPAQAAELTRQVRERLVAYASPDGVTMPGAAWLVTAQAV